VAIVIVAVVVVVVSVNEEIMWAVIVCWALLPRSETVQPNDGLMEISPLYGPFASFSFGLVSGIAIQFGTGTRILEWLYKRIFVFVYGSHHMSVAQCYKQPNICYLFIYWYFFFFFFWRHAICCDNTSVNEHEPRAIIKRRTYFQQFDRSIGVMRKSHEDNIIPGISWLQFIMWREQLAAKLQLLSTGKLLKWTDSGL